MNVEDAGLIVGQEKHPVKKKGGPPGLVCDNHGPEIPSDRQFCLSLDPLHTMHMKLTFPLSLVLLALVLFSCAPSPLWENPISPIKQTDRRLAGAWGQSGSPILFIGDPVDGWMSFVLGDRKNSELRIFGRFYVSELEGRKFLNVKIYAPWDLSDLYFIAEYRIDSNSHLFVALPNHDFLRKATKDKRLSGRIEESDSGGEILIFSCDSSDIRTIIRDSPKEILFPESPSDVLKRLR